MARSSQSGDDHLKKFLTAKKLATKKTQTKQASKKTEPKLTLNQRATPSLNFSDSTPSGEYATGTNGRSDTSFLSFKTRRYLIAIISLALLFGLGYQFGSNNASRPVDEAIERIIEVGPLNVDKKVLERAAIEGALTASGDEWANYFPVEAVDIFRSGLENKYSGVGLYFVKNKTGAIKIKKIVVDSPASREDIRIDDEVIEVDGTNARGIELTALIGMIQGNSGEKIQFLLSRSNKTFRVSLKKSPLKRLSVEVSVLGKEVLLLQISSFAAGTSQEVANALRKYSHKKGVVLDLRNNPGGTVEEAVNVARQFLSKGVIVSYDQTEAPPVIYNSTTTSPDNAPLIILINHATASAAEILAGALQDRNRAVILGEKSYGKGSVQEFITLRDGAKLELTVALYRTPSGRTIEGKGISPDLVVKDEEIAKKTLQVLGGLVSLTKETSKSGK